jgi:pimeloyl-ACP methyl ester carboxylesterase
MIETCCQFGPQQQLAGIVTEPQGEAPRLTCVLINAGLVPKFGPYRLYAQLARRLAQASIRTLRFDLGDIGESRQAFPGRTLEDRTHLEIAAAVDHAAHLHGADDAGIVLGGLCSGAEDSFRYAERDPRVKAVVLIDPFAYRTRGWHWHHRLYRATRRSLRWLGRYEPIDYGAGIPGGAASELPRLEYKQMERTESSRILRTLIDRGVRVHFVYTGGVRESFNHAGQLRAMFKGIAFKGMVSLDYFPQVEHLQALHEEREALIESICRRLDATARRQLRRDHDAAPSSSFAAASAF